MGKPPQKPKKFEGIRICCSAALPFSTPCQPCVANPGPRLPKQVTMLWPRPESEISQCQKCGSSWLENGGNTLQHADIARRLHFIKLNRDNGLRRTLRAGFETEPGKLPMRHAHVGRLAGAFNAECKSEHLGDGALLLPGERSVPTPAFGNGGIRMPCADSCARGAGEFEARIALVHAIMERRSLDGEGLRGCSKHGLTGFHFRWTMSEKPRQRSIGQRCPVCANIRFYGISRKIYHCAISN